MQSAGAAGQQLLLCCGHHTGTELLLRCGGNVGTKVTSGAGGQDGGGGGTPEFTSLRDPEEVADREAPLCTHKRAQDVSLGASAREPRDGRKQCRAPQSAGSGFESQL